MKEAFKKQLPLVLGTFLSLHVTEVIIAKRESSFSDIVKSLAEIETHLKKIKPRLR